MVINWLVILLVSLFIVATLTLLLFVVDFKNKSLVENTEFQEKLYSIATKKTSDDEDDLERNDD